MIYIANEVFMSMAQGIIYFQTFDQITLLWDPEQNSNLEIVDVIIRSESVITQTNKTKVNTIETNGYMRPVDMHLPPTGSYIK